MTESLDKLIKEDRNPIPYNYPKDIWDKATFIDRPELAVASADDDRHYLGTGGLSVCIGITLYDPLRRVGAVGHGLFDPDPQSYDTTFLTEGISIDGKRAWPIVEGPGQIHTEGKHITGGVIIPDDISRENHFSLYLEAMIQLAKGNGGEYFNLWLFNMMESFRKERQDKELKSAIKRSLIPFLDRGLIHDVTYRPESGFSIDIKSGNFYHTY